MCFVCVWNRKRQCTQISRLYSTRIDIQLSCIPLVAQRRCKQLRTKPRRLLRRGFGGFGASGLGSQEDHRIAPHVHRLAQLCVQKHSKLKVVAHGHTHISPGASAIVHEFGIVDVSQPVGFQTDEVRQPVLAFASFAQRRRTIQTRRTAAQFTDQQLHVCPRLLVQHCTFKQQGIQQSAVLF